MKTAAIFLLMTSSILADQPVIVLTGPSGGVPGDILILDASASKAEHFAWSVTPELPDGRQTIMPLENGTKCLITSVPGTYTVFLAISTADGISMKRHTVTVIGKNCPDDPQPQPGPQPKPPEPQPPQPLPDGKYKLAADAYRWAVAINDPTGAANLASAFETISSQAAAGGFSGINEMLKATTEANRAAVDRNKWLQPFFVPFDKRLSELNKSGDLRSIDDHATAWTEIAVGLRRAAK